MTRDSEGRREGALFHGARLFDDAAGGGRACSGALSIRPQIPEYAAMTKTDNPLASKALALVWIGIGAADPSLAVNAAMPSVIADPPRSGGSWRIIAVGKAARAMAMTAMKQLPDAQTLIIHI